MDIAMIGTRGVPARYGGFETAIEEIGSRLVSRGHSVRVFCRGGDSSIRSHLGMDLTHLPAIRYKTAETLSHTFLSVLHPALRGIDAVFLFNAANSPLIPVVRLRGIPVAVHVDGLEWKRSKWGRLGQRYYLVAERFATRRADALIADAVGIQNYYLEKYGVRCRFIPYGAHILHSPAMQRLAEVDLLPGGYHLLVARFEPENHVLHAVQAYLKSPMRYPLVLVGSAPYSAAYVDEIKRLSKACASIRLLGSVWDQELLDVLYAGSRSYLHGHSVGGTNPSLLRALGAGARPLALDVPFNREVAGPAGAYWSNVDQLAQLLASADQDTGSWDAGKAEAQDRARRYDWDAVAGEYETLATQLASGAL